MGSTIRSSLLDLPNAEKDGWTEIQSSAPINHVIEDGSSAFSAEEENTIAGYFRRYFGCSFEEYMGVRASSYEAAQMWRKICSSLHAAISKWEQYIQPVSREDGKLILQDRRLIVPFGQEQIDAALFALTRAILAENFGSSGGWGLFVVDEDGVEVERFKKIRGMK